MRWRKGSPHLALNPHFCVFFFALLALLLIEKALFFPLNKGFLFIFCVSLCFSLTFFLASPFFTLSFSVSLSLSLSLSFFSFFLPSCFSCQFLVLVFCFCFVCFLLQDVVLFLFFFLLSCFVLNHNIRFVLLCILFLVVVVSLCLLFWYF